MCFRLTLKLISDCDVVFEQHRLIRPVKLGGRQDSDHLKSHSVIRKIKIEFRAHKKLHETSDV